MTRRIDLIPDRRERAALEALWRAQGWPQAQIDGLGDRLRDDEVLDGSLFEVRAVLAALDALPVPPRKAGPLNPADVSALALDVGAHVMIVLASGPDALDRAVIWGRGVPPATLDPKEALAVRKLVARALIAMDAAAAHPLPAAPASNPETQS